MIEDFAKGFFKGLKLVYDIDRMDNIKEAHALASNHQYQEALDILEKLRLPSSENSAAVLTAYLIKAVCYAELGYNTSAKNSVNVILSKSRFSINITYQMTLSDAQKMANEIKTEYNL